MKPEQWRAKHQQKQRAKSMYPDIGTYKPFPADLQTFGKMLLDQEEKKQIAQKKVVLQIFYLSYLDMGKRRSF